MLERQAAVLGTQDGVPRPRRAVVGRQPNDPGVVPQPRPDEAGERDAAMPGDHAVGAGGRDLGLELGARRRGEDEAVDPRGRAMDRHQLAPVEAEAQGPRQSRHPTARLGVDGRARERVPPCRQALARRALVEAAAAVLGPGSERLLDVAHHHGDGGRAHRLDGGLGVGAVGHRVAGADDVVRRYTQARGLAENRLGGLEVAVWPAEDEHGTGEPSPLGDAVHDARPCRRSPRPP